MAAPAITIGGILDSITAAKSHPLEKATTNPPTNVAVSCKNFPTWKTSKIIALSIYLFRTDSKSTQIMEENCSF
jgi:hypothetical protein